jgi:hypothetical protein
MNRTHDNTRAVYRFIRRRIGFQTLLIASFQDLSDFFDGTVVEVKITGLDKPPNKGRISQMADDRMRNNDDLDRNMGGAGQKDQDKQGQQSPGRSQQPNDDMSTGQRGAGQREQGHKEDFSKSDKGAGQGGQNRQNR